MEICVVHLGTLLISDFDFTATGETFSFDGSSIFVLAVKSDSVDFGPGVDTFNSIFSTQFFPLVLG